ncbi:DinB family protein [Bacteroidota bacterium]
MKQIRWFDRKFEFSFDQNIFPSIIERLDGTPLRLKNKVSTIPSEHLATKLDNTWSIQENIGHLIDLEPLWLGRLEDILNNEKELRPADLKNRETDLAEHNNKSIDVLLAEFKNVRTDILNRLKELSEEEVYKYSLHPRLKTPMRIMDLFLFVAEHDDHHLARITEINKMLKA